VATASGAYAILKARFEANKPAGLTALRWQNQNEDSTGAIALPDTPAAFAYVEFETDPQQLAGYGGGRGANLYRNPARLQILVFVPKRAGAGGRAPTSPSSLRDDLPQLSRFKPCRASRLRCSRAATGPS
jgi:hypothetical protein